MLFPQIQQAPSPDFRKVGKSLCQFFCLFAPMILFHCIYLSHMFNLISFLEKHISTWGKATESPGYAQDSCGTSTVCSQNDNMVTEYH